MSLENIVKNEMKFQNIKQEVGTRRFLAYNETNPTLNFYPVNVKEKFTIVLMGDEHIGSKNYLPDYHKNYLDWCCDTKTPFIHMGDMLECATRNSVGAGVYEQNEIIQEQMEHAYNIYKEAIDKKLIMGMHIGNHEARVWKSSGINVTKLMAKQFNSKYFGFGKAHYFLVKCGKHKEGYTMYTTHGASGARLPQTKIKSVLDLANMIDVEIYGMGHTHQLASHTRVFYHLNKKNKMIDPGEKHFILTGSYMGHWGSYAHVANLEPMKIGSPKIKLSGKEHRIRVSV